MGHGTPALVVGMPRNSLPPKRHEDEVGALDGSVDLRSGAATPHLRRMDFRKESVRASSPRSHRRSRLPRRRRDGTCPAFSPPRTAARSRSNPKDLSQLRARLTRSPTLRTQMSRSDMVIRSEAATEPASRLRDAVRTSLKRNAARCIWKDLEITHAVILQNRKKPLSQHGLHDTLAL
jgi:hypothetical protein